MGGRGIPPKPRGEAAHPEIKLTLGGQFGRGDLRESLRDEGYWGELAAVLALGGVFIGDSTFYAPYVFERFPSRIDPFEGCVVIGEGEDVRVRAAPDVESAVLGTPAEDPLTRPVCPAPTRHFLLSGLVAILLFAACGPGGGGGASDDESSFRVTTPRPGCITRSASGLMPCRASKPLQWASFR